MRLKLQNKILSKGEIAAVLKYLKEKHRRSPYRVLCSLLYAR